MTPLMGGQEGRWVVTIDPFEPFEFAFVSAKIMTDTRDVEPTR